MKNYFKLIAALGLIFSSHPVYAQLTTTSTSLAAAVTANSSAQWCLNSATGVNVPSTSQAGTYLFAEKEVAQVTSAGSSSTCFNVKRGQLGTSSGVGHYISTPVWVGNVATGTGDSSRPFSGGVLTPNVPNGVCTASAQYSLPVLIYGPQNSPFAGGLARCVSGFWIVSTGGGMAVTQPNPYYPYTAFTTLSPPSGIATTSVTDVAGKIWWSQINIPTSATVTGACVLNGATVGADKWIFALYDANGTLVANTATAGVTTATASKYQCIAFTATAAVVGPATYYVAVQGNGTTDNFQSYATASAPPSYSTGSQTGTFGTLATIAVTAPPSFVAANGPLMMLY